MQEYLDETVGSCTRRMILYQVSDITFLMMLCNSPLTMTYLLDCHIWYVMFSHETSIWVFWMIVCVFAHWTLAWHCFFSCPIPWDHAILARLSFVVILFEQVFCCEFGSMFCIPYLEYTHVCGCPIPQDYVILTWCLLRDFFWAGLLLWIWLCYAYPFRI